MAPSAHIYQREARNWQNASEAYCRLLIDDTRGTRPAVGTYNRARRNPSTGRRRESA